MVCVIQLLFIVLLNFYHYVLIEASSETCQGQSQISLAPAPHRCANSQFPGTEQGVWHIEKASFEGLEVLEPDCGEHGAISSRLEMHGLLANKQGEYAEMCQVWDQVDAWERPDLHTAEGPLQAQKSTQNSSAVVMAVYVMGRRVNMGRCSMGRAEMGVQQEAKRQHATQTDAQVQEGQECLHVQSTLARTAMALPIYRGCGFSTDGNRRCGERQSCFTSNGTEGIQHAGPRAGSAYRGGALSASPDIEGAQKCGGQDGQSEEKVEGRPKSTGELTCQLEHLYCRLHEEVDAIRRTVRQGRSGLGREGEERPRQIAADQGRCREQESSFGRTRQRWSSGGHRRRDGGQARHCRDYQKQHRHHGGQSTESTAEGGGYQHRTGRVEAKAPSTGRWRRAAATRWGSWLGWLSVAVNGAFCEARQTDLKEVCLGEKAALKRFF